MLLLFVVAIEMCILCVSFLLIQYEVLFCDRRTVCVFVCVVFVNTFFDQTNTEYQVLCFLGA